MVGANHSFDAASRPATLPPPHRRHSSVPPFSSLITSARGPVFSAKHEAAALLGSRLFAHADALTVGIALKKPFHINYTTILLSSCFGFVVPSWCDFWHTDSSSSPRGFTASKLLSVKSQISVHVRCVSLRAAISHTHEALA